MKLYQLMGRMRRWHRRCQESNFSNQLVWQSRSRSRRVYSEFRGNAELALTPDTVKSFYCASRKSNAPNVFRSGIARTRLYAAQVCELFYRVNSVTIHYYWRWRRSRTKILELCLGPRDPKTELGSFFIHCCESSAGAFLFVHKQSDVVNIANIRESELARACSCLRNQMPLSNLRMWHASAVGTLCGFLSTDAMPRLHPVWNDNG